MLAQFDPHNTILVSTYFLLAPRLAQEKLGFALATICLNPISIRSIEKMPIFLNKFSFLPRIEKLPR